MVVVWRWRAGLGGGPKAGRGQSLDGVRRSVRRSGRSPPRDEPSASGRYYLLDIHQLAGGCFSPLRGISYLRPLHLIEFGGVSSPALRSVLPPSQVRYSAEKAPRGKLCGRFLLRKAGKRQDPLQIQTQTIPVQALPSPLCFGFEELSFILVQFFPPPSLPLCTLRFHPAVISEAGSNDKRRGGPSPRRGPAQVNKGVVIDLSGTSRGGA